MTLELYVWGPAFALPSIDPQCLAALAYVSSQAKREGVRWQLVTSNDPSISPTRQLPCLRHQSTTISGLENIIDYVDAQVFSRPHGSSSLDQSPAELADLTAFTSHILHHSPPLFSLSLFVSTPNYTAVTRPTYSTLLPWPTQYIVPPQLRSRAQAQTEHLGLTSPDIIDNDQNNDALGQRNKSIIPESLRTLGSRKGGSGQAKTTVTGALAQQSQAGSARFRLDALVDDFCAPLSDLLGQKGRDLKKKRQQYMLSSSPPLDNHGDEENENENESPSSLDCVAAAHLSLMLIPGLPQDWLATRIQHRWPALATYAQAMGNELWGGEKYTETLPWRTTDLSARTWTASLSSSSSVLTDYALSSTRILGLSNSKSIYTAPLASSTTTSTDNPMTQANNVNDNGDDDKPRQQQQEEAHTLPTVLLTAAAAAAGLAVAASTSVYFLAPYLSSPQSLPPAAASAEEQRSGEKNLGEMGEAGALLSGVEIGALGTGW